MEWSQRLRADCCVLSLRGLIPVVSVRTSACILLRSDLFIAGLCRKPVIDCDVFYFVEMFVDVAERPVLFF